MITPDESSMERIPALLRRYEAAWRLREAIAARLNAEVEMGIELGRARWWDPFGRAAALAYRALAALEMAEAELAARGGRDAQSDPCAAAENAMEPCNADHLRRGVACGACARLEGP
jgi:hypothetical protein